MTPPEEIYARSTSPSRPTSEGRSEPTAHTALTGAWSCPVCEFAFSPTAAVIALDYCPRCVARRHVEDSRGDADAELARRFDLVFDDYRSGRARGPAASRLGIPSS